MRVTDGASWELEGAGAASVLDDCTAVDELGYIEGQGVLVIVVIVDEGATDEEPFASVVCEAKHTVYQHTLF